MAENPVLPESIEQLIAKEADVPVIISYTSHEYLMIIKGEYSKELKEKRGRY